MNFPGRQYLFEAINDFTDHAHCHNPDAVRIGILTTAILLSCSCRSQVSENFLTADEAKTPKAFVLPAENNRDKAHEVTSVPDDMFGEKAMKGIWPNDEID